MSQKTYHQKLSWFFGPGISSLDPTRAPVESDIVKLCVYVLDNFRTESGNYFLAPDETQMVKIVKGILIDKAGLEAGLEAVQEVHNEERRSHGYWLCLKVTGAG